MNINEKNIDLQDEAQVVLEPYEDEESVIKRFPKEEDIL